MIKIRIRNDDHEIDLQFPISENKLYAKLAEIHAIEGKDAPQSAFVTEVYWPEELSMLKDRFANLDELNYLARRMESFDYQNERMNIEMNAILKSKSMRLLSALLAVLMIVAMLPTSAFAWSAEEGTKCTSTYGDKYLGSDGDNYYSKAGNTLFYNDDGSFYVSYHSGGVARYKYLMIDSNGTSHHVYCIESGVSYNYSDTYNSTSGKNSKYFQNLPVTAQYGIMMALMYGWHDGASSPVAGTNVDDFIYATQCIIWEYQQQIRTSPTSLASANGVEADLFYATLKDRPAEKCYDWILEQMSRHYVVPSFSSRNQSNAQTYTMIRQKPSSIPTRSAAMQTSSKNTGSAAAQQTASD